jgi:glutamyl-tRNA synthetase
VIRGDDHLTNAARQTLIYEALGYTPPIFAHIPLIHGPDGAKLSKRHGALGVGEYRDMGYLPEAMRNYLARLGWAHGDDEFFTTEQAIEWFDLGGIGKSAARFDFAKLENLNGQHMRAADDAYLADVVAQTMGSRDGPDLTDNQKDALRGAMPGLKERAKTIMELIDSAYYIYAARPLELDAKARKLLSEDVLPMLSELTSHLRDATQWRAAELEETVKSFAAARDMKLGKVAQPLRAALTGRATSPGIYDVMMTLGREETLARLENQIAA